MTDKAKEAAEEYGKEVVAAFVNANPIAKANSFLAHKAGFLAGVEWLKKELLDGDEEFDHQKLYDAYSSLGLDYKSTYGICEVGARWQHSQDQLKMTTLREEAEKDYDGMREFQMKFIKADKRIEELEAEISRLKQKYEGKFEGRA